MDCGYELRFTRPSLPEAMLLVTEDVMTVLQHMYTFVTSTELLLCTSQYLKSSVLQEPRINKRGSSTIPEKCEIGTCDN